MNTLLRDFAIVVALLVLAVVWKLFGAVSGRDRRKERERSQAHADAAARAAARPGIAPMVGADGWVGPTTALPPGSMVQQYVHEMTCHLWRVHPGELTGDQHVGDTEYHNAFTGQTDGHRWYLANAVTPVRFPGALVPNDGRLTAGVCSVDLGDVLPPLWVGPRDRTASVPIVLKEVTLESEDFNRRFRVQALDRKYAFDLVSPRVMELVMQRDDWTFFLAFGSLVCISREPLTDVQAMQERLALLLRFVGMIPSFVEAVRGAHLPTLPDGTTLDPSDPQSLEKAEQALAAMSPAEREQALQQVQAEGLRFVAGMFGKDLQPEELAQIQERMTQRRHQEGAD